MSDITTIGLDLAKSIFQVHGVDATGAVVVRRQLRRRELFRFFESLPLCLIGMEACATAHYWGRELRAMGHEVRLIPPAYVKPYVKRNKNDAADAEAICEAVIRPSTRFVGIKTVDQQSILSVHRARDLLVRQRTMLVNSLRGLMAEFGVAEAQGRMGVGRLIEIVGDETDKDPPLRPQDLFGPVQGSRSHTPRKSRHSRGPDHTRSPPPRQTTPRPGGRRRKPGRNHQEAPTRANHRCPLRTLPC